MAVPEVKLELVGHEIRSHKRLLGIHEYLGHTLRQLVEDKVELGVLSEISCKRLIAVFLGTGAYL